MGWNDGRLDGNWIGFLFGIFWGNFWRRGTHVNTPKIGSRGEGKCLGEFLEFHADLRRKCFWGNLNLTLFWGLGVGPRVSIEEGGQLVFFCAFEGVFLGELPCHVWMGWPIWPRYAGDGGGSTKINRRWRGDWVRTTAAGEGFLIKNILHWRGDWVRTTAAGEGFLIKNILHWRGDWVRTTAAGEEDEGFLRATVAGGGVYSKGSW
jgi:hypothetical protein